MSILFLTYSILLFIALTLVGVLVFYAINKVTHAEWAMSLYPIMKHITTPLWLVLLVLLGVLYAVHREPYFMLRAVGYMAVWVGYRHTLKKFKSLEIVFE